MLSTKFRDRRFLLTKIAAKSHHSGVREVQMMLSTLKRIMKVNRMNINSATDNFKTEADLKDVSMDDTDDKPSLPVDLILGNRERPRISTTQT